jgi:YDG domain
VVGAGAGSGSGTNQGAPPTETAYGGFVINDGNGGNNYAVTLQSAAGAITPKPLTVGLTGDIFKIYDGNTIATVPASDYRLSGLIAGDSVTLGAPSQGSYDTPFQGTGKTVTVTGFTLGGAEAGDYTVTGSASAQIGTICLAGCVLPPVFDTLLVVPGLVKTYQLQFGFLQQFPFGGDFPLAPDDDSSPKGDIFPVTGAGNRDLWSGPSTESNPGCPPGGSDTGACQGHTP